MNNMHNLPNFIDKGAKNMKCCLFGGREDLEHTGVGLVKTYRIFATRHAISLGTVSLPMYTTKC